MTERENELIEKVALALLNDDRAARGLHALASRAKVPDSEGYVRNARAIIPIVQEYERAAIVEWLRGQPSLIAASPVHVRQNSPHLLANAIERGEHKKGPVT